MHLDDADTVRHVYSAVMLCMVMGLPPLCCHCYSLMSAMRNHLSAGSSRLRPPQTLSDRQLASYDVVWNELYARLGGSNNSWVLRSIGHRACSECRKASSLGYGMQCDSLEAAVTGRC